jgi:hypothetical protein
VENRIGAAIVAAEGGLSEADQGLEHSPNPSAITGQEHAAMTLEAHGLITDEVAGFFDSYSRHAQLLFASAWGKLGVPMRHASGGMAQGLALAVQLGILHRRNIRYRGFWIHELPDANLKIAEAIASGELESSIRERFKLTEQGFETERTTTERFLNVDNSRQLALACLAEGKGGALLATGPAREGMRKLEGDDRFLVQGLGPCAIPVLGSGLGLTARVTRTRIRRLRHEFQAGNEVQLVRTALASNVADLPAAQGRSRSVKRSDPSASRAPKAR